MCYWFDCKNNKKELCGKKYFFMQQEFLDKTLEKRGGFPKKGKTSLLIYVFHVFYLRFLLNAF